MSNSVTDTTLYHLVRANDFFARVEALNNEKEREARIQVTVTLKDIAKETGVTPTVVSHVLNNRLGHIRVSEAKRIRIEEAAGRMGYVVNLKARSLVTRKSYTLGLICSDHAVSDNIELRAAFDAYLSSALRGVESVCRESGYHCLVTYYDLNSVETFVHPRAMKDGSMDGAVLIGYTSRDVAQKLESMHIPCVQIGSNIDAGCGLECVYADLDGGFEQAVRNFADLGHRKVQLYLPGGPGPEFHAKSFLKLNNDVSGVATEAVLACSKISEVSTARNHARELLKRKDMPTAFIADIADVMGLSEGLAEGGLECPRDYSLACFSSNYLDRYIGCKGVKSPLSLIYWNGAETGRIAARRLLARLGVIEVEDDEREQIMVPCELIHGTSTQSR